MKYETSCWLNYGKASTKMISCFRQNCYFMIYLTISNGKLVHSLCMDKWSIRRNIPHWKGGRTKHSTLCGISLPFIVGGHHWDFCIIGIVWSFFKTILQQELTVIRCSSQDVCSSGEYENFLWRMRGSILGDFTSRSS